MAGSWSKGDRRPTTLCCSSVVTEVRRNWKNLWISHCPHPGLHKYNFSRMSADTQQRLALWAADKWRQSEWPVQLELTNHHYIYEKKSIFLTFEITNCITVNSSLKTAFSLYMLHYLIFVLPNYMLLIRYERDTTHLEIKTKNIYISAHRTHTTDSLPLHLTLILSLLPDALL